ncbi:MAG: D-alanine--D-alanine ligase [Synergistaceae bacterium]|nr:D-alanine--D-alanine ligase [Synergistaceae bacterium]
MRKVAVLCGGDGREREVSLRSGKAVTDALNEAGFEAFMIDLLRLDDADRLKGAGIDGVFIAMHGDWGEGGQLQERLTSLRIPYTGSDAHASALAMDKWESQRFFERAGIPVPKSIFIPKNYDDVARELGTDVVVKPCSGGSTVGVSIIHSLTPQNLNDALNLARDSYAGEVMAEEYIPGREITCAVWERNGKAEALPVIEIKPHTGYYDYTNKYTKGATEYIVPAELPEEIAKMIGDYAVKAHEALGCRAYSRSDFRLTEDGRAYILEVNTAPGMTETSLVPKAARAAGVSMTEFVKSIMKMAKS